MANVVNNSLPKPVFSDCVKSQKRKAEDTKISSLIIESPLSKEGLNARTKLRKLSGNSKYDNDGMEFGTDLETLSKIYDFNFTTPPIKGNMHSFFALGEMMMQIECLLKDHFSSEHLESLREQLENILLNIELTHERKMAELGCILYFLDRDRLFPSIETPSFVNFRAEEICIEIEELIDKHIEMEELDKMHLIPTGKMHYLLRTFAKMIVTTDQKLNIGSLHALILMLEDSTFDVVTHLKPEHHSHILCVLKQMITNSSFKNLIEKKIHVHPDLISLICIDLKINKVEEIPSVAVMWDCIMALLFDIRQQDEYGNCFAVSALIYAVENSPYKVLVYMIEALTKGHFAFNDTIAIPILPIVEKKLIYEKDLTSIQMPSSQALELTAFQNISSTLNLISSSLDSEESSLHNTLSELMVVNKAEDKLPYAQKLLYTFKHNALIHMLLELIEFQHTNSPFFPSTTSPFSIHKQNFLDTLYSLLPFLTHEDYIKKFKQRVEEHFWLKDSIEIHVSKEKSGEIKYGPSYNQKTIKNFGGNVDSLCHLLKNARRVYFLKNGKYEVIETITELQEKLEQIAEEINEESGNTYNFSSSLTTNNIKAYTKTIIAQFCLNELKLDKVEGISEENLINSNLLILLETGGAGQYCLSQTFGLKYSTFNFATTNTREFLEKYYNTLKELENKITPRTFLLQSKDHAFTLNFKESLIAFQNTHSFNSWINGKIHSRAAHLLKKKMPKKEAKALIKRFINLFPQAINLSSLTFDNPSLQYKSFYDLVLKKFDTPVLRLNFTDFFDKEIMKVKFSKSLLKNLLEKMKIELEQKPFIKLLKSIKCRIKESTAPFIMAREIRKSLIDHKLKIISPLLLEQYICDSASLPIPVDVGDFNYFDSHREDPIHVRLIIRYHFGNQTLQFFLRKKSIETSEQCESYMNFQIFYPSV